MSYISIKLLSVPAILIALVIHEVSHGYTAWKLGDPTAKNMGRLTLNPFAHLDPVGALLMLFVGFGWAKPVPVDMRYFRNPRKGMAVTALMGPVSNILMALIGAFLAVLTDRFYGFLFVRDILSDLGKEILTSFYYFFYIFHTVNLSLAVFNLIPLPPLDGSRIAGLILPNKVYYRLLSRERQLSMIFLIWLLAGSYIGDFLLSQPIVFSSPFLRILVKILSLTGWMNDAVGFLSDAIMKLFSFL